MKSPATNGSPVMFCVLLGIMVAAVLAFVLLRPNPSSVHAPKVTTSPISSQ